MKNSAAASGSPLRSATAARRRVASAIRSPSSAPWDRPSTPSQSVSARRSSSVSSASSARPNSASAASSGSPPRAEARSGSATSASSGSPVLAESQRAASSGPAAASVRENDSQPSRSALSRRGLRVNRKGEGVPSADDTIFSSHIRRKAESLLDERLDRYEIHRYRAAMHRSVGTPSKTIRDHGPTARWYGFVFFGYVPPALLAGREAMSR